MTSRGKNPPCMHTGHHAPRGSPVIQPCAESPRQNSSRMNVSTGFWSLPDSREGGFAWMLKAFDCADLDCFHQPRTVHARERHVRKRMRADCVLVYVHPQAFEIE